MRKSEKKLLKIRGLEIKENSSELGNLAFILHSKRARLGKEVVKGKIK